MTPIALRDHKRIQLYLDIIVKHKITGARWVRLRDKLSAVVDDNERMPRRRVMVMVMIVITMITMKLNMTRLEHRHLWLSASYFAVKARPLYRPRYLLQVYHSLGNSQHLPRSHPWKIIWLVVTGCNKVLYQCDLMIIWQSSLRSAGVLPCTRLQIVEMLQIAAHHCHVRWRHFYLCTQTCKRWLTLLHKTCRRCILSLW